MATTAEEFEAKARLARMEAEARAYKEAMDAMRAHLTNYLKDVDVLEEALEEIGAYTEALLETLAPS